MSLRQSRTAGCREPVGCRSVSGASRASPPERGFLLFDPRDVCVRRLTAVVAVLVLTSGCNAIGNAGPSPAETVTAAPVPAVETANRTTTDRADCAAPRPGPAPESTPAPRDEPVALPIAEGRINGSALAALHGRSLSNYSFHLRAGSSGEVWALPDVAAFTYEGIGLGAGLGSTQSGAPWSYAIGGRLYSLRTDNGQLVFDERPYRADSPERDRLRRALTGERWLASRVAPYNYTVVGTRTVNGTELRVLEDTLDQPVLRRPDPRAGAMLEVNSTLYVDRYGIVRAARHVERLRYVPKAGIPNETRVSTLEVDRIGTADLHRPAAFCVTNPDAMRTAAPTDSQTATHTGPTTVDTSASNASAVDTPTPNPPAGAQTTAPPTTPAATRTTMADS